MRHKENIILILDSIVDDYYFLWECFYDFKKYNKTDNNTLDSFSEALKEAFKNKFINFFKGENFDGDEVFLTNFQLTDPIIKEFSSWQSGSEINIRVTTSDRGIDFLNKNRTSPSINPIKK